MVQPISIAIIGLGTVGTGTLTLLKQNENEIFRRTGRKVAISYVGVRQPREGIDATIQQTADLMSIVSATDVDIVVEVIGGKTVAKEVICGAIQHKKHVVTANKALLAEHGSEIFALAEQHGVQVRYEAAVAGGIPIIKAVREGLAANQIDWLAGIINGTGNFILTEMSQKGRAFGDVLAEAQALGYAEADPTFDVEGIDAAHKLMLLASNAFGIPLQFEHVYTEGITQLQSEDVAYASEMGYQIKHLGIARRTDNGIELRVHPTLIPKSNLIANVHGVKNAVMVHGNAAGSTMYYGSGAGAGPTASAVVADIIDLVRNISLDAQQSSTPHLAFMPQHMAPVQVLPITEVVSGYYLRVMVRDQAGALATITQTLKDFGISIDGILQKPAHNVADVPVVVLTESVVEHVMNDAIKAIEALSEVHTAVVKIRVEQLVG